MEKILVVDDQFDIRRLLAITLGGSYEVIEARDGVGALEMLRCHHPKIVLLDVMMPGDIDGIDVLDVIKRDPEFSDVRVAMITARGQSNDVRLGEEHGADAYFIKPFGPLQVIRWVEAMLR
ncbi:response regulator [Ferriphaselus sp. R-1]|uniref:response regulator transcription factor n=1 Tax=Ferriphaselus sp. R-1 TaxID=1485544 RepID=UPI000550FC44|nr:response regulator [Ferriphaselus sp. R-1]